MAILSSALLLFLALSGVYSIIASLVRLENTGPKGTEQASSLQTKWFHWLAPAGLVYGVLAIVGTILLIRYDATKKSDASVAEYLMRVKQLEDDNRRLRASIGDTTGSTTSSFSVTFETTGSKPILGGRILLTYEGDRLIFAGSQGVADRLDWDYATNMHSADAPAKFFLKMSYREIWGINLFRNENGGKTLNFYRP